MPVQVGIMTDEHGNEYVRMMFQMGPLSSAVIVPVLHAEAFVKALHYQTRDLVEQWRRGKRSQLITPGNGLVVPDGVREN